MKFQPDASSKVFINGYGPDWVVVSGEKHVGSAMVCSETGLQAWNCQDASQLSEADFERLAQMNVEIVLYGSGERLVFPPHSLIKPLIKKGIGLETMDTAAACRTFNVLAGEGRKVAAALLFPAAPEL
jgi:uncharacterized protein